MGNEGSSGGGSGGNDNGGGWTNSSSDSGGNNRCEVAQREADSICSRGSDTSAGFSGGSEISNGIACLAAQDNADIACKK